MSRRRKHSRRAFTIIEAISTIVILGALGSVASTILLTATDGYLEASLHAEMHTELSVTMDRLVREIRNIPNDDTVTTVAVPDITNVTATSLAWGTNGEMSLSGTTLQLRTDGGAALRTLLKDVTTFSVKAYDESNAFLGASLTGAACDAIRRIELDLTMSRQGVTETLRTRVYLRCTMESYVP